MGNRTVVFLTFGLLACLGNIETKAQETGGATAADLLSGVEFHGLIQGWYQGQSNGGPDAFSVRRAEIAFSGFVSREVGWTIMLDPSKGLAHNNTFSSIGGEEVLTGSAVDQGSKALQDAFLTVELPNGLQLRAGQFHLPLSLEGLQPSGDLEVVERALFASDHGRGGFYGDVRDVGVSASGGNGTALQYTVGVFNGLGTGIGSAGGKGFASRVVFRPSEELGLQVGASGAYAANPQRKRYGAEARLDRGPLVLKSEIMGGQDGQLKRLGFYGLAALDLHQDVQGVVRFDSWDPDTDSETASWDAVERNFTAGISLFVLDRSLKLQANYVRQWFGSEIAPAQNRLWLNIQTAW